MNDVPRAVITGRRVAMVGLIVAMVLTMMAVIVLIAIWTTQPVVI